MKEHKLKTWIPYYRDIINDIKTFEIRKNDRDFKVGDILILEEWDDIKETYTGHFIYMRVGYILKGGQFGIEDGYVVMTLNNY